MTETRNRQRTRDEGPLLGGQPPSRAGYRARATGIALLLALAVTLAMAVPRYRVVDDGGLRPTPGPLPTVNAPLIDWQSSARPPPPLLPATLVPFNGGFAALAEPASGRSAVWLAGPAGAKWSRLGLPATPLGLTPSANGLFGFRNRTLWAIEPDPGGGWSVTELSELPDLARLGYGSGRPAVLAIDEHILLQSPEGELWLGDPTRGYELVVPRGTWSLDIRDPWEAATQAQPPGPCRPPSERGSRLCAGAGGWGRTGCTRIGLVNDPAWAMAAMRANRVDFARRSRLGGSRRHRRVPADHLHLRCRRSPRRRHSGRRQRTWGARSVYVGRRAHLEPDNDPRHAWLR